MGQKTNFTTAIPSHGIPTESHSYRQDNL